MWRYLEQIVLNALMDVVNVISSHAIVVQWVFTLKMETVTDVILHVHRAAQIQFIVMFVCLDILKLSMIGVDV